MSYSDYDGGGDDGGDDEPIVAVTAETNGDGEDDESMVKLLDITGKWADYRDKFSTPNPSGLSFDDDALQLIPQELWIATALWYNEPISTRGGIFVRFTFKAGGVADGFTLTFQAAGKNAIGIAGGGLGVKGVRHAVVIEFDQYQNGESDIRDPPTPHVAVHTKGKLVNTLEANSCCGAAHLPKLKADEEHDVEVVYNYLEKELIVRFDGEEKLTLGLDLERTISCPFCWVGFTAASGGAYMTAALTALKLSTAAMDGDTKALASPFTYISESAMNTACQRSDDVDSRSRSASLASSSSGSGSTSSSSASVREENRLQLDVVDYDYDY